MKPIVIANWKMKMTPQAAGEAAKKLLKATAKFSNVEIVLCPAFTEIASVAQVIAGSHLRLGAQDAFWEEEGAYTGEVSARSLKEYGVKFVLAGHSERRQFFGETGEMINKKIKMIVTLGLVPVLCVNESFEQRQVGDKDLVLIQSVQAALSNVWLNKLDRIVIAYEPVWAIGTGQVALPAEVEHTNRVLRQAAYDILPPEVVNEQARFIYGGSVDAQNVSSFLSQPTVQGVLVGSASIDPVQFTALVASVSRQAAV